MSSEHTHDHEERLERVLAGAEDPVSALAASELASCPECRAMAKELEDLTNLLDATGAELHEADEAEDRAHDELVERVLGPHLRPTRPTPGPAVVRLWLGVAAAAVVLFVLFLSAPWPGDRPEPGLLGPGDDWEAGFPVGEVAAWNTFTWSGPAEGVGWYELRIRARDADADAPELLLAPDLREPAWTPTTEETATWPEEGIRWEVRVIDGSGRRIAVFSHEAWLSSR